MTALAYLATALALSIAIMGSAAKARLEREADKGKREPDTTEQSE